MDAKQREKARTTASDVFDYLCELYEYDLAAAKAEVTGKAIRKKKPEVPEVDLGLLMMVEPVLLPFVASWHRIAQAQADAEKQVEAAVKTLPVWDWVETNPAARGFSASGLAAIVGSCGDLSEYATPAKVWKRMGVGLVGDEIQRRVSDTELGILHGYSPERRSVLWNIADNLRKAQVRALKDENDEKIGSTAIGPVGQLYIDRKLYETTKNAAGDYAEQAAKIAKKLGAKAPKENAEGRLTKKHIDNRAMRYASKKFVKFLWQAWRDAAATTSEREAIKRAISRHGPPDAPILIAAE